MTRRNIVIGISFFLLIFALIVVSLSVVHESSTVVINGKTYTVDIADTKYLSEKGLSGRKSLESNEGMFFMFSKPDNYGFWMKDMLFPIDIIWIDQNFKIIHVEKSISPDTYPKVFYPEGNAVYVLEVSAGQVAKLNIKAGDSVKFIRK